MAKTKTLFAAAALLSLPACGVPTEDYDARTAELRKAEDRANRCGDAVKQEEQKATEAQQGLEEMRAQVRELQGKQLSDTERAAFQRMQGDTTKAKQEAAERKADRESLARNLKEEIEAGVVWLDERRGSTRVVIPEEALFSSGSASLGPPGKKVLDAVAREVRGLPPRQVMVAAFLDRGPKSKAKDDFQLTADRARKVADYLIKQGLEPERVASAGWGEAEPIADNGNDEQRVRNRRIEVQLLWPVVLSSPAVATPAGGKEKATPARVEPARVEPARVEPARVDNVRPATPAPPPVTAGDDPGL